MNNNYNILLRKLRQFSRKYYTNLLIRGAAWAAGILVSLLALFALLEYVNNFSSETRLILLVSYSVVALVVLSFTVIYPLFKLLRLGKPLSDRRAAAIIGSHFSEVNDTLLNTLQLRERSEQEADENGLLAAAIDQKIEQLKPIPFLAAIPLKKSLLVAKYALIPVLVWLLLTLISPQFAQKPVERILKYDTFFEQEMPFKILIENAELTAVQHEDFLLKVSTTGTEVPNEIYIVVENGSAILLTKTGRNAFEYRFTNLRNSLKFELRSGAVVLSNQQLRVFPRPSIWQFSCTLDYPNYTQRANEVIENIGTVSVPTGTTLTWDFYTKNCSEIHVHADDSTAVVSKTGSNIFSYKKQVFETVKFTVSPENDYAIDGDTLFFSCEVIPDGYPIIAVSELKDSIFGDNIYFNGSIEDDYGFSKLLFIAEMGEKGKDFLYVDTLAVPKKLLKSDFYYRTNVTNLGLKPGDEVSYFFEVWDNDAVNGSKASRSQKMFYRVLSLEERQEDIAERGEKLSSDMEQMKQQAMDIKADVEELQKKLLQKETLEWEDKAAIEQLLEKQQNLQKEVDLMKQENKVRNQLEQSYKTPNPELVEKQKELEQLMNELMSDEMKEMMEEMKALMDEAQKDKMQGVLEQMEQAMTDYEEQLDRNLEMFRQLEFEKKLEETIQKTEELAEKQEELAAETESFKNRDAEELKEKQEALNSEAEKLDKEMDALEEQDKELENPNGFQKPEEEMDGAQEDMKESAEQLGEKKKKSAEKAQKSAAQKMKEAAKKMASMQSQMQMKKQGEDMESLRMILENLIAISFAQEDLINLSNTTSRTSPKYVEIGREQNKLANSMVLVSDSLKALAKRQSSIDRTIRTTLKEVEVNMDQSIKKVADFRLGNPGMNQQYAMTAVNNLALLLEEILEQMQQQMDSMSASSGSSSCDNPSSSGGGDPKSGMPSMKELQKQMSEQLEKMKGEQEGGKEKGEKPGSQGGPGSAQMSEQLARMAAQQMQLRQMMQEYMEQGEGSGGEGNLKKIMEQMEQNESDIINRNITQATLRRQQEILTRMLKAEQAEQEREEEKRRESNEVKNQKYSNPPAIFEYKGENAEKVELLRTVPPEFKLYYKNRANEYLYKIDN